MSSKDEPATMKWQQIVQELFVSLVYLACRLSFGFFQNLWWLVNGTYFAKGKSRRREGYGKSAQVLDIRWKGKLSPLIMPNSILDFLTVHNRFEHPSVVLRDNVTIYAITSSYAMFVEAKDGVDVTNTDFSSFMKIAQFIYAKRVIVLPIEAFHRLADELGDPKGEMIYMTNIGRCGSTLLSRIYEETGKCVVYTEPDVITSLSVKHGRMGEAEFNRLAKSTIRLLCKPRSSSPDYHVIKICGPAMLSGVVPLKKVYPQAKLVFLYRDLVKAAQSFTKVKEEDPFFKLLDYFVVGYMPFLQDMGMRACGLNPDGFPHAKHHLSKYFSLLVVLCVKYKELRQAGISISAIKYEDMLEDPEYATRAILRYSGLDENLVVKSLKAYARDTHKDGHSPFSQQRVNRHKPCPVTPAVRVELDEICTRFGLPKTSERFVLERTITNKDDMNGYLQKNGLSSRNGVVKNGLCAKNGLVHNGHLHNGVNGHFRLNGHNSAVNDPVANGVNGTHVYLNGYANLSNGQVTVT